MSRRPLTTLLLLALIAPLVVLATPPTAEAGSQLGVMVEIATASDDMDSGGIEWSGATFDPVRNVLVTVDDESNAYEFALDEDGRIDDAVPPRVITIATGHDDFEGVAWLHGDTYGLLSEASGEVIVVTIRSGAAVIEASDVVSSFPVVTGTWGNLGPEGLAFDGNSFFVARELPATLSKFTADGRFQASVDLTHLADASGVTALADGTFLIVSHESRTVAHYAVDWASETATLLERRDAELFTQLEGIASIDGTDVHLFGEDNTRKGFSGQTYSHLRGAIVTVDYGVSDMDCSGGLDVTDALIVARIDVGLLQARDGCGSGDHNGDGSIDIFDAIQIAQCGVGLINAGCPNGLD